MDDDVQDEPVASGPKDEGTGEPTPAHSETTEFRVPDKGSLTRPDIPVRRPKNDEAESPAPQGPWYVQLPNESAPTPPESAGPTRVEPLPALPPQNAPMQYPAARSSGQWTVPWENTAPPPAVPPIPPVETGTEPTRRGRRWPIVLAAALVLVVGLVAGQIVRPVPEPAVELTLASRHAFPGQAPALPWPSVGQAIVLVDGLGVMGTSGGSTPIPTASVAKVMTAFVYLRDHPLEPGKPGPVQTVSPEGVAQIPMREKREESILGITANQQLTQRKALEALLIISANDVAHELARWDTGDEQAFVAKMNAAAKSLGMTSTHYTDPSGYDSRTVSTAADQVKLLRAAMELPSFPEIVNNQSYVPDGGGAPRQGGNFLLGQYGVVGGKTGYTDAAGGNFVFAARKDVQGVATLIVGAVMGQNSPSSAGAVSAAGQLVGAAEGALVTARLAPKGGRVGHVDDGLGGTTPLRAASPVTVVGWPGLTVRVSVQGNPPNQARKGEQVATITAGAAEVPLRVGQTLDKPSILHRLLRVN